MDILWNIVTIAVVIIRIEAVYRYGDVTKGAAFPCRCTEGCYPDNGSCVLGECENVPPSVNKWRGAACRFGNVAYGKPAEQSGTYDRLTAELAVDGLIGPGRNSKQCAYPYSNDRAWWYVDLGTVHVIFNVTLYNMDDGYYEILSDFRLHVGNSTTVSSNQICYEQNAIAVPRGGSQTVQCYTPMYGRYVGLRRNENSYDQSYAIICEFVAIGRSVVDCSSCPRTSSCDDYHGCEQCPNGTTLPDCKRECDNGRYGANCEQKCSLHCKDPMSCDLSNGTCLSGCRDIINYASDDWWLGEKCDLHVPAIPRMPLRNIRLIERKLNSIKIQWKDAFNISKDIARYYGYIMYYRLQSEIRWHNGGNVTFTMPKIFELGGLEPNTSYTITISMIRVYIDGAFYEADLDYDELLSLKATTLSIDKVVDGGLPEDGNATPIIAGGVIAGIAFAAVLVVLILLFIRHKRRRISRNARNAGMAKMSLNGKSGPHYDVKDSTFDEHDETSLDSNAQSDDWEKEGTEEVEEMGQLYENARRSTLIENTSIKVIGLEEYVNNKMNESEWFKKEFQGLPQGQVLECQAGSTQKNINKNRFKNIKAYDKTRVILDALSAGGTDYINANYITGYGGRKGAYVAAQAPKPATVDEFWSMIWQLHITTIVMLTEIIEIGKQKSALYWPEKIGKPKSYGKLTVTALRIDVYAEYGSRLLRITKGDQELTVHHFQFLGWPDKSVPNDTFPMIAFRNMVASRDNNSKSPLLVHCSAGVGRTGTYIAIDCLIKQAQSEGEIDVVRLVTQMRRERMTMIQTLSQYLFVYDAVLDATCCGNTSLHISELEKDLGEMLKSDTGTLERQFELLSSLRPSGVDVNAAGLRSKNMSKNRERAIIPGDKLRPHLTMSSEFRSDYINAVFVNSFKEQRGMIATQSPLPETVIDFWRLVYDHDCGAIVMLDRDELQTESAATYWKDEKDVSQSFGSFEITMLSSRTIGNIKLRMLQLTKEKNFKDNEVARTVHHFQVMEKRSPTGLPDAHTLLDLFDQIDACDFKGKVLLHCTNGASRSGLFCAARYMLEKMSIEKEVDIFLAVRYVSNIRPQFVNDLAQYRFLHELAMEQHLRHTLYANI